MIGKEEITNYDIALGIFFAIGAMASLGSYQYKRYCEAEEWKDTLDEEEGYDTGYAVDCDYGEDIYPSHGFIFSDGSVMDIGIYEDHRIINIEKWCEEQMVTYTYSSGDMNLRVNCGINSKQIMTMENLIKKVEPNTVFVDIYNYEDRYLGYLELSGYECNYETLQDYIYDALEGKTSMLRR